MKNKRVELMNEALSEHGIMPFHSLDNPLTDELCEIIGSLYRLCQTLGQTEKDIEVWIAASPNQRK